MTHIYLKTRTFLLLRVTMTLTVMKDMTLLTHTTPSGLTVCTVDLLHLSSQLYTNGLWQNKALHITEDFTPFSIFTLFFPEIMHLVVEEIYRYYNQYLDTLDEAQTLLLDMMITWNYEWLSEMRATFNKLNDNARLSPFHEGIWGKRGLPPLILNISTRRGKWSASHPGYFVHDTHWTEGWVGTRDGLDALEKREVCCT